MSSYIGPPWWKTEKLVRLDEFWTVALLFLLPIAVNLGQWLSFGFGNGENSCQQAFLVEPSWAMVTSINIFLFFLKVTSHLVHLFMSISTSPSDSLSGTKLSSFFSSVSCSHFFDICWTFFTLVVILSKSMRSFFTACSSIFFSCIFLLFSSFSLPSVIPFLEALGFFLPPSC